MIVCVFLSSYVIFYALTIFTAQDFTLCIQMTKGMKEGSFMPFVAKSIMYYLSFFKSSITVFKPLTNVSKPCTAVYDAEALSATIPVRLRNSLVRLLI